MEEMRPCTGPGHTATWKLNLGFLTSGPCFSQRRTAAWPQAAVLISELLLSYAVMTHSTPSCGLQPQSFMFSLTLHESQGSTGLCSVLFSCQKEKPLSQTWLLSWQWRRVMADHAMAPKASTWTQTAPLLLTSWPKQVIQPMGQEMSTSPWEGTKEGPCRMSLIEKSCKYFEQF